MLRHPQRLLLRALLARGGAASGGTTPIPIAAAGAAEARGALGPWAEQEQPRHHPSSLLFSPSRGFASRGPSFLDPQGRRAMKQKRQAKARQRLLRDMKGGSSVVAVGGTGDVAAVAVAARRRAAAAAAAAEAEAAAAAAATAAAPVDSTATSTQQGTPAAPAAAAAASPPPPPLSRAADDDGGPEDDDAANAPGTPIEMQREQSSWLPGWMRSIMPESLGGGFGGSGGRSRSRWRQQQQEAAATTASNQDAAATSTTSTDDGDDGRYANLEKYRDLNLEAFLQHQGEQSDDAPPPPRPPPDRRVPQLSPLRRAHQSDESRRVLYYRARHHVRIVEALREDERAVIEADPRRAVKRERLLRSVAARTGYSPGQVADCLQAYESLRFRVNALCDWRAAGRRMPRTQAELTAVVEAARRDRDEQDLQVLLAERRTPGERCPLKPGHLSALGGRKRAVCPQTRLPYSECCGALEVGAAAGGRGGKGVAAAML